MNTINFVENLNTLIHKGQILQNETFLMYQHALKNANNCLNTNIYYYLETSGGQSSNLYLKVFHFFNASVN